MSIDDWAKKVAAEISLGEDGRAPADAAILAHLHEFEALALQTRLKIPAFARALTRAGLTLRSGEPYSAATLRAQIHRARARRTEENETAGPACPNQEILDPAMPSRSEQDQLVFATAVMPAGPTSGPSINLAALDRMQRTRPKRPKLGRSEG